MGAVRLRDAGGRPDDQIRTALVLSAGGLRGAAHVGVLRQLVHHNIPIDMIVGVSAGAVVAAYYAAVGLELDELIADAETFRGRHLLTYGLNVRLDYRFDHRLERWCGVIPRRLRELEHARFDRLHHGTQRLGIVCHDVSRRRPVYFATGAEQGVTLYEVVRASASIPYLFPPISVFHRDEELRLTDGGLSDPVPLAFARSGTIGATHIIVSDCRWIGAVPAVDSRTVWIRPRMPHTGTLWSPHRGLLAALDNGESAVTPEIVGRIRRWFGERAGAFESETGFQPLLRIIG